MVMKEDICEIVNQVCTMMLGTPVDPADPGELALPHDRITGCVQIAGEWSGVVMLQATKTFVSLAARHMLALDDQDVNLADQQDTVAELTNMIGGNIKSLVPGPSYLSLPSVTVGKEFDIRLYGTEIETAVPFHCQGQRLCVLVHRAVNQEVLTTC